MVYLASGVGVHASPQPFVSYWLKLGGWLYVRIIVPCRLKPTPRFIDYLRGVVLQSAYQ